MEEVNASTANIAIKLKIDKRFEQFYKIEAFITLKNLKTNILNKPAGLKAEMGKISRAVLQE